MIPDHFTPTRTGLLRLSFLRDFSPRFAVGVFFSATHMKDQNPTTTGKLRKAFLEAMHPELIEGLSLEEGIVYSAVVLLAVLRSGDPVVVNEIEKLAGVSSSILSRDKIAFCLGRLHAQGLIASDSVYESFTCPTIVGSLKFK